PPYCQRACSMFRSHVPSESVPRDASRIQQSLLEQSPRSTEKSRSIPRHLAYALKLPRSWDPLSKFLAKFFDAETSLHANGNLFISHSLKDMAETVKPALLHLKLMHWHHQILPLQTVTKIS